MPPIRHLPARNHQHRNNPLPYQRTKRGFWPVGMRVLKSFGNSRLYGGKINRWDTIWANGTKTRYYHIKYDDGDKEHINRQPPNEIDSMVAAAYNADPDIMYESRSKNANKVLLDHQLNCKRGIFIKFDNTDEKSMILDLLHATLKHFHSNNMWFNQVRDVNEISSMVLDFDGLCPQSPEDQRRFRAYIDFANSLGYTTDDLKSMGEVLKNTFIDALREIEHIGDDDEITTRWESCVVSSTTTSMNFPHTKFCDYFEVHRMFEHIESGNDVVTTDVYKQKVPFTCIISFDKEGTIIQIHAKRSNHNNVPNTFERIPNDGGVLVKIPYGKMLFLRADVVIADGYKLLKGNGHYAMFQIYKNVPGYVRNVPARRATQRYDSFACTYWEPNPIFDLYIEKYNHSIGICDNTRFDIRDPNMEQN